MKRWPDQPPESRFIGATPASAAIPSRVAVPSSGRVTTRHAAEVRPMPCTDSRIAIASLSEATSSISASMRLSRLRIRAASSPIAAFDVAAHVRTRQAAAFCFRFFGLQRESADARPAPSDPRERPPPASRAGPFNREQRHLSQPDRVDRVGLGVSPNGARKVTCALRLHEHHWNIRFAECDTPCLSRRTVSSRQATHKGVGEGLHERRFLSARMSLKPTQICDAPRLA